MAGNQLYVAAWEQSREYAGCQSVAVGSAVAAWAHWSYRGRRDRLGATGSQGLPGSVGPPGNRDAQGLQGIAGQAGAQGLTGATGRAGIAGADGAAGCGRAGGCCRFRGAYSSVVNYGLADGVLYGGAGYVSLVAEQSGEYAGCESGEVGFVRRCRSYGGYWAAGSYRSLRVLVDRRACRGWRGRLGLTGATGAQGPAVANYTGNFVSGTNYGLNDAVSYGGGDVYLAGGGERGAYAVGESSAVGGAGGAGDSRSLLVLRVRSGRGTGRELRVLPGLLGRRGLR